MNGFTDIHTHILPAVDDGAKDIHEACELVRTAWQDGTRTIFLTPHYRGKYKENSVAWLQECFSIFSQLVADELPDMKLYLGHEVHFENDVPEKLLSGEILSMNGSGYVLLEFRMHALRSQIIRGVSEITRCGFTPIIAHAERYDVFRADATLTDEVLELGARIQVNADSVMGAYGFSVKRFCHKLLKTHRVHFVATDAHDRENRSPLLHRCFLRVCKKYGQDYATKIFYENAQAFIDE